jgi:hypothetical protein
MKAWLPDVRDLLALVALALIVAGVYLATPLPWAMIVTGFLVLILTLSRPRRPRGPRD